MTNDEYQAQARERRRTEEQAASFKKNLDDYAQSQRYQQARQAEASKKAYSQNLGAMGATPSIFGPAVDLGSYLKGKQQRDAFNRMTESINPSASRPAPQFTCGGSAIGGVTLGGARIWRSSVAGRRRKSGAGKVMVFLGLIILAVFFFASHGRDTPSSASQHSNYLPASPVGEAKPVDHTEQPQQTQVNPSNEAQASERTSSSDVTPNSPQQITGRASGVEPSSPQSYYGTQPSSDPQPSPLGTAAEASPPAISGPKYHSTWRAKGHAALGSVAPWAANPTPWPAEGLRYSAHHKGGDSCDGQLFLMASGLEFVCPGDRGRSFSVALNQVRELDNDGIKLFTGKKYHFDNIPGRTKHDVEQLFEEWMYRTHLVESGVQ